jgi:hypothetical protein
LETATQNQTSVPLTTTFNQQVNTPILRVQAIASLTPTFYDFVGIGLGNSVVQINSLNGITSKAYALESGTQSQFLKGDGVPDTNTYLTTGSASTTYLPLAGGTVTGTIAMGANKVTTTYVPVSSADLCNKTYVDSIAGTASYQGFPFNPLQNATTGAPLTSGNKTYFYTVRINRATTINGFNIYISAGSDPVRCAIYRNFYRQSPSNIATLVGQSASTPAITSLPYISGAITAVALQNLNFAQGEYMIIAFASQGTTNAFWGSTGYGVGNYDIASLTSVTTYVANGFPSTLTYLSPTATLLNKICMELY